MCLSRTLISCRDTVITCKVSYLGGDECNYIGHEYAPTGFGKSQSIGALMNTLASLVLKRESFLSNTNKNSAV